MENSYGAPQADILRRQRVQLSYRTALNNYKTLDSINRIPWVVWIVTIGTVGMWCFTAYQAALAADAHGPYNILMNVVNNAITIRDQDNQALSDVLVRYGAKENSLILHGQYWRFVTPIFLHANALHVGLNMLNFFILGIFLERLVGHLRFLLIYLVTGVVSIIASFYFAPQEISVGASGAIFGLVGAYSIFILIHRRAFPRGGIPALLWLVLIVGINLGIGIAVPNVDNYAHVGGLVSGCLLGWWFTPLYKTAQSASSQSVHPTPSAYSSYTLVDTHSLSRRWPLALLTIVGTFVLAIIALYHTGG